MTSKEQNLEPEYFQWLDHAEEFFKHNGELNYGHERNKYVKRNRRTYTEIAREYQQLEKLHNADPSHFAEPLMPWEKNGEIIGFHLERKQGVDLQEYIKKSTDIEELEEIIEKVETAKDNIHHEGLVHGDLANNGIYNPKTGELTFIDPVGVPYTEEDHEKMKEMDGSDYERLKKLAFYPIHTRH